MFTIHHAKSLKLELRAVVNCKCMGHPDKVVQWYLRAPLMVISYQQEPFFLFNSQ
jgi:hypothetical protein